MLGRFPIEIAIQIRLLITYFHIVKIYVMSFVSNFIWVSISIELNKASTLIATKADKFLPRCFINMILCIRLFYVQIKSTTYSKIP